VVCRGGVARLKGACEKAMIVRPKRGECCTQMKRHVTGNIILSFRMGAPAEVPLSGKTMDGLPIRANEDSTTEASYGTFLAPVKRSRNRLSRIDVRESENISLQG